MKWSIQKHDSQQKFFELAKHLKTDSDVNSKFIINKLEKHSESADLRQAYRFDTTL